MLSESPHHDLVEVDEQTHPYSRVELDRLRQVADLDPSCALADAPCGEASESTETTDVSARSPLAVVPSVAAVSERASNDSDRDPQEWFQLEGRWLRVSLESFAHFGLNGAPPGMIGSMDASVVSGTINGQASAPLHPLPRLTQVYEAAAPEPQPEPAPTKSRPPSRQHDRALWLVLAAAPLVLALGIWVIVRAGKTHELSKREPVAPTQSESGVRAPLAVEPTTPVAAPPIPSAPAKPEDGEAGDVVIFQDQDDEPRRHGPRKSAAESDACDEHRKLAMRAHDGGKWALLEELAQRRSCWSRPSEAKALQMRALFELERFRECVEFGAQGGSKEMMKWVNNCQRALAK